LVEHSTENAGVTGSIPVLGTIFPAVYFPELLPQLHPDSGFAENDLVA
jgi:hypothetical protein